MPDPEKRPGGAPADPWTPASAAREAKGFPFGAVAVLLLIVAGAAAALYHKFRDAAPVAPPGHAHYESGGRPGAQIGLEFGPQPAHLVSMQTHRSARTPPHRGSRS